MEKTQRRLGGTLAKLIFAHFSVPQCRYNEIYLSKTKQDCDFEIPNISVTLKTPSDAIVSSFEQVKESTVTMKL